MTGDADDEANIDDDNDMADDSDQGADMGDAMAKGAGAEMVMVQLPMGALVETNAVNEDGSLVDPNRKFLCSVSGWLKRREKPVNICIQKKKEAGWLQLSYMTSVVDVTHLWQQQAGIVIAVALYL